MKVGSRATLCHPYELADATREVGQCCHTALMLGDGKRTLDDPHWFEECLEIAKDGAADDFIAPQHGE